MSEYKKIVTLMAEQNKELFDNFKDIHDNYALNPAEWQKLFNEYGGEVMDIMRDYERKLLSNMGTGNMDSFRSISKRSNCTQLVVYNNRIIFSFLIILIQVLTGM